LGNNSPGGKNPSLSNFIPIFLMKLKITGWDTFLITAVKFYFMNKNQKRDVIKYNPAVFSRASSLISLFLSLILPFLIFWIFNKSTVLHQEAWSFFVKSIMTFTIILGLLGIRKLILIILFVARGK